jgi:hypothetical protein
MGKYLWNDYLFVSCKLIYIIIKGPWSEHGTAWYNCNRYEESQDAKDNKSKSRATLERYLHVSSI